MSAYKLKRIIDTVNFRCHYDSHYKCISMLLKSLELSADFIRPRSNWVNQPHVEAYVLDRYW